jgi:hypothetical protein
MAQSNNKNIDQLFKQKLKGFELTSQDSSWKMLQMVKNKNLRLKNIFFAKTLLEVALLFSTALFLTLSDDSSSVGSLSITPLYIQETPHNANSFNNENHSSRQLNGVSVQKSKTINKDVFSSVELKKNTSQDFIEENRFDLEPKFGLPIDKKESLQLLASEAKTSYENGSQSEKKSIQKTREEGINSPYDEYAPVINKDGSFMFFTSRRPVTDKEIRKGEGRERIYYTETNATGWTEPKLLQSPINSEKNFNSAVSLSKDGKSLFIYRDDRFGNGDLYESKLNGYNWSTPEALPSPINSEFHESTLSLTADGNTVYFTSNRTGGIGGMDIWTTKKNKAGMWEDAKNLGNIINTKGDEEGVFIHPDGKTLFFSSRGHKGMGGYDIYYTTLENGQWTKPINLGPDINTKNDDVYFVLEENGTDAYFTSVDPKTPEKKDIFRIKYNQFHQNTTLDKHSLLEGTVLSKNNKTPIKAQIEIYGKDNNKLISSIESDTKTGGFSIPLAIGKDYRILIYRKGYLNYTEEIVTNSIKNSQVINKTILLDQLKSNTQFILKELTKNEKSFNQNIKTKLNELYQLMTLNPELKIQLSLETNNDKDFNEINNQKLINECVDYLKLKDFNKDRVNGKIVMKNQTRELPKGVSTLYAKITSN